MPPARPSVRPAEWLIDPAEIRRSLLDLAHPVGGSKARSFRGFGFHDGNEALPAAALLEHPRPETSLREGVTPPGDVRLVFAGPVPAPDGRWPRVTTVWRIEGARTAPFVTAVPVTP